MVLEARFENCGELMKREAENIRAFIAIELPSNVRDFLEEIATQLKKCGADVKWVRINGIHLTLKFLGYVSTDLIATIQDELNPIFQEQKPFILEVSQLGAFPGLSKPRVIWAGLNDPTNVLRPLTSRLEDALEPFGFKPEKRPFTPHLTLGRVRSSRNSHDLIEMIRQKGELIGPNFLTDHAVLFQSVLKPSGAEYFILRSFDFGA